MEMDRTPPGSRARAGYRTGMTGVAATIDAVVVATAQAAGGGVILTSAPLEKSLHLLWSGVMSVHRGTRHCWGA